MAVGKIDRVNAPTLIRATSVAGHPPAKPNVCAAGGQIHHARDEASRVAAPGLTTSNRTAAICADSAIIAAHEKAAGGNLLKSISPVGAEFQHATVETEIRIRIRCFKIEVVPECQSRAKNLEKNEIQRVEPFVAHHGGIIDESCIGRRISRWHWHSRVRCDPKRRRTLCIYRRPIRGQCRGRHTIEVFVPRSQCTWETLQWTWINSGKDVDSSPPSNIVWRTRAPALFIGNKMSRLIQDCPALRNIVTQLRLRAP